MRSFHFVQRFVPGLLALAALSSMGGVASARPVPASEIVDRSEPLPERLRGIDVKERLGDELPKDVVFKDETGRQVKLGDMFDGHQPVILTLNYSRCPMLCSLELNGLITALKELDWTAGKEFKLVTIVLDPSETPDQAAKSKARYLRQYGKPNSEGGWHFLTTTDDAAIHRVSNSVGFSYGFNEKRNEYVHPAAIVLLSPTGHVSRYLYGIDYKPKTVRLSLVEASEGKVGTSIDQLVLYCFHYDAKEGSYAPVAMNIMRVSSGLSVMLLGGVLTSFWLTETRKKKQAASTSDEGSGGSSPS